MGALAHNSSHDAADELRRDIMLWRAEKDALDQDLKDKCAIEARVYDLYRNNDLFRGLVEKQVDTIVGSKMILQCKPDYEALGATPADAKEWCKMTEREFHNYADSPENWISADRSMDFTQMCRSATRSKIFTGEILASREWRASPLGYKTCFALASTDRLRSPKNNQGILDGKTFRDVFHGIEFDKYGAAVAYHIERFKRKDKSTPFDPVNNGDKETKRYTRYNRFGWLQVFHIYEPFKTEYPRGISRIACVLTKLKQLDRFHQADLDKAIIATSYVFAITSEEDPESVADMLSGAGNVAKGGQFAATHEMQGLKPEVQAKRDEILKEISERYVKLTGGQIMHLFKGEDVKVVGSPTQMGQSSQFAKGHTKNIANGVGMSYELGTGDFDGVNFAGGQMSLGIYEHSANIERKLYVHKFAKLCYRSWLDEAIDKGTVPLLNGMDYWRNKEAYSRCEFSGAKRVHVDPVKQARSTSIDLANGVVSRTDVVNANGGDIEQVTRNRASEAELILTAIRQVADARGLELSREAEMSLVIDLIATKEVKTPEIVVESTDGE